MSRINNYSLFNLNSRIGKVEAKANLALANLNVEYKSHQAASFNTVSTTHAIHHLTGVSQGDTAITRDGDQCKLKSIQFNCVIVPNASATQTILRHIIFVDTMQDGTAPTAAEVLGDTAATQTLVSMKNMDNKNRFVILVDRIQACHGTTDTPVHWRWFKKFNTRLHFTGNGSTDTIGTHYYYMVVSNETTNTPTVYFRSMIRFLDN